MRDELEVKITEGKDPARVDLVNMTISDDEIQEIIALIQRVKPNTLRLDFDRNNIGDTGAIILAKFLANFDDLKELGLQFNQIGKEGALALFRLKKVFPELDILFHGNAITNVGEMREIERLAIE